MKLVISLGGSALLRKGEAVTACNQQENASRAAMWLEPIIRRHATVLTHGTRAQLAMLALQSFSYTVAEPARLDALCAQAAGETGYLIERELRSRITDHTICTLLAQVLVDPADPGFARPSKPIGPFYEKTHAHQLRQRYGWEFADFDGRFRRLAAVPRPLKILELDAIRSLVHSGQTVLASGPVPVAPLSPDKLQGVEALPDSDAFASLLAREFDAEILLLLTDVTSLSIDYGSPSQRHIRTADAAALRDIAFDQSSIRPKIEAAAAFAAATGRWAAIGAIPDVGRMLSGEAGTRIVPDMNGAMEMWDQ